ncbi:CHASE3 domain-containing protein [Mesorhizobium sp. CAU 1732]|uniref:sensor histidine kinase n=1 Tax=Mesorhizobium sp. CAU 1732 TaxID=3140358 RepID=UPI003260FF41
MPITRATFVRTSAILLIAGLLALLAIVGTTIWLVERTQGYFDEVLEARQIRAATVNLRTGLQDAETGQRGYLLTLEENYLAPYDAAVSDILPNYERLAQALASNPAAQEPMRRLREGLVIKIGEMAETIQLARDGRRDAALAIVQTDRGKRIMDESRAFFDQTIEAADERVTAGGAAQRSSSKALEWVSILGGLAIVVVGGGSVWTALAYTRELVEARTEVDTLNLGLEERVKERTQDLVRANEEVQRFAYIVTHDLRAPLVNIMGFTAELDETMKSIQSYVLADGDTLSEQEIQEARTAASEDLPEAIGFIRSSTRKMDGLINAILKISRDGRRPLKPETIDLKALLEANLATVQHQIAEADGTATLDVKVPTLVTDRMSLEQILGNLIDNAVKYRANRPLEINVTARRAPAGQVLIDVSDNGRGIAAKDHERVFDLFRRSGQQDKPGEGIGLAHVRTLVRGLGGDISLSSEHGVGTTFSILLPIDVRTVTRSKET